MRVPRFGGYAAVIRATSEEVVAQMLVLTGAELMLGGENPAGIQGYYIPETREGLVYAETDTAADVFESVCKEKKLFPKDGLVWDDAESMAEAKRNYSGELLLGLAEEFGIDAEKLQKRLKEMGGWFWNW